MRFGVAKLSVRGHDRGMVVATMLRRCSLPLLAALSFGCSSPTNPSAPATTSDEWRALGVNNLAVPQPGLLTAGQPDAAQFEALGKRGVTKVICLRPATETGTGWEEEHAQRLGMQFVRLPIAGADDVTEANARKLAALLAEPTAGPTLVCCGSSNRVGALLALKAFHFDKLPAEQAVEVGKNAGLKSLEPTVRQRLQ